MNMTETYVTFASVGAAGATHILNKFEVLSLKMFSTLISFEANMLLKITIINSILT